jgi:hypothetical protein
LTRPIECPPVQNPEEKFNGNGLTYYPLLAFSKKFLNIGDMLEDAKPE